MYAIVDIGGQQFKVEKEQKLYVHRLDGEVGSSVDFDQVLLVDNDGKIVVGTPVVKNTIVSAKIVSHLKGDTVKVFKKKRRKGYQKLNGHRQYFTELLIENIGEGTARKVEAKKAEPKKPETKAEVKAPQAAEKAPAKAATKAATVTTDKKAPAEKPVAAAKKAPAKKAATLKSKPATAKAPAKKAAAKKPAATKAPAKKADDKKGTKK
ncbi:MAG: 50S ribosomal protein L21 [Bacteroidales bacterium]|nr:50S ribosomal protein L21 [Bacteroidales bacterium]